MIFVRKPATRQTVTLIERIAYVTPVVHKNFSSILSVIRCALCRHVIGTKEIVVIAPLVVGQLCYRTMSDRKSVPIENATGITTVMISHRNKIQLTSMF